MSAPNTFRRRTLPLATAAIFGRPGANTGQGQVVAGAIRWDAWYQPADNSVFAQGSLGWKQYQGRAPAHCRVTGEDHIDCVGTQAVMNAEIRAAHGAGLGYWAFVWYAVGSSFRTAWNLYQASAIRDLVNWCGIVGLDRLGSVPFGKGGWRANVEEWAGYMRQPQYQKIAVGAAARRPVLFLLWQARALETHFASSVDNVKIALRYLHDRVVAAGLDSPYVVILDGVPGGALREACGADAISSYISGFRGEQAGPYVDLDRQTRAYWAALAATGQPIVPIAMLGWDTRPRLEHPVPWEHHGAAPQDIRRYYVLPTPDEFAAHIQAAVGYIRDHPASCPSRLLLIYSWDECDEGGGMIPTRGDPEGHYLSALRRALPRG